MSLPSAFTAKTASLHAGSEEIEYTIVRSSRRTMAIHIRPGGVVQVRAPWYLPAYLIKQFVEAKSSWIIRHREKLRNHKPQAQQHDPVPGSTLPFLGRSLTLRVLRGSKYAVAVTGDELTVTGPGVDSGDRLKALIERWYLSEAVKYFSIRTRELAQEHSTLLPQPVSVRVRKMKSRWGTCKSDGTICFNRELIKKETRLIDSVIIHELCHLVHHNHGKEFYSLLESIIPDYKSRRRELRSR